MCTGSGAGIGQAIARGLHEAGATVFVHDLSGELVEQAIGSWAAASGCGASRGRRLGRRLHALIEQVPDVDVLVNNVGFGKMDPVWRSPTPTGS